MTCLMFIIVTIVNFWLATVNADIKLHKIVTLPDSASVEFNQYSGYVTIGDDMNNSRAMFYYFVEAEVHPTSKPLVLWFQGGPGCSSVGNGALREHGPLTINGTHLVANNYSWNKEANMLYLDSPAGVGFSYSTNKSYFIDDETAARDNFLFLKKWLARYSEYKNNHFYISGESYAGHFAPQLADLIIKSKAKINLKGIVIGNPLLDFNTDYNGRPTYLWSHGLISDDTYELFRTVCNFSQFQRETMKGAYSPNCERVRVQAFTENSGNVDFRTVLLNKCPRRKPQAHPLQLQTYDGGIDVCTVDEINVYLNRVDVRKAMHARLVDDNEWSHCRAVNFDYANYELSIIPILGSLVRSGVRVLAYSGDQDSLIPFTGTRTLIAKLAKELGLNTTLPYHVWFEGKKVAGWTQIYANGSLCFATVRGAGHEAPIPQPEKMLRLFKSFVRGEALPHKDKYK